MGFLRQPHVIRRLVLYGASLALLLAVLSRARSHGQNGLHAVQPSLLTFDGIQHALLGDMFASKKSRDRDSYLELRDGIDAAGGNPSPGNSIHNKEVVFASARDIPTHDSAGRPNYVPGQLIVRFRNGTSHRRQDQLIQEQGARILHTLNAHRGEYLVALAGGLPVPAAAEQFAKLQEVDFVEPNALHYINDMPNDDLYAAYHSQPAELQRWYFSGLGLDTNLNAETAWSLTTGNSNVVIAVIDTGVALQHPDLAANMWTNPGEIPDNRIDDDGNGFVDDVRGWDFYSDDNDPNPDLGDGVSGDHNVFHGTFVAGCAAAVGNNHLGVAGATWQCQIMPLKVFTYAGGAPASAIADAIHYAIDNGAHVINMSFGSSVPSKIIYNVIQDATDAGIIMVAAAGNGNSSQRSFPACFSGVIAVGGSGSGSASSGSPAAMRGRASFSQFGAKAVDVVAPAVDIVSTALLSESDEQQGYGRAGDFEYFYGNGTSFASPLVAGEAALLLSRMYELGLDGCVNVRTIERIILTATTNLSDDPSDCPDGGAKWAGHGRVDFCAAISQISTQLVIAPAAPKRLSTSLTGSGAVKVNWQDNSSNEQSFLIERAEKNGNTLSAFESIAEVDRNITTYTDTTAQPGTTYRYRVAAVNPVATTYVHKASAIITP
jgi:subtilisin family serine protease